MLNFSVPPFLYLTNKDNNNTYVRELLKRFTVYLAFVSPQQMLDLITPEIGRGYLAQLALSSLLITLMSAQVPFLLFVLVDLTLKVSLNIVLK